MRINAIFCCVLFGVQCSTRILDGGDSIAVMQSEDMDLHITFIHTDYFSVV